MLAELIANSVLRKEYLSKALRPDFSVVVQKLKEFESNANADYFAAFERMEVKKGEYLLREGEVPKYAFFMESGLARLFSHRENDEITADFFFSSEFVDLYGSSALKLPAHANIQVMADSVLYRLSWDTLSELQVKYPILMLLEKMVSACYMRTFELRTFDMLSLKAEDRYIKLINEHPYILDQVPLNQIASYLGIKLETLSRLRSKLSATED